MSHNEIIYGHVNRKFSHPHVRSRLEKLMGSNVVSLTDRGYMQRLQERILEDYAQNMCKRIATRQAEEMERVKNLVLIGKIPLEHAPPEMANHPVMLIEMYCNKLIDERRAKVYKYCIVLEHAPPEMANHPVMLIEMYCNKLIDERRAKIKLQKIHIPNYLYWDDTPDPPSGLCIEKGHAFRKNDQSLCTSPERLLIPTEEEEIENRYMFSSEEFENMKYEDPLIKDLKECETVEEMYALADEIIGVLKTITERKEEFTEMQLLESLNQPRESCPPEVPPEPSGRRMSVRPIPTL
ncbi:hypothetical protein QE152_g37174 [Popillia japonica]|uniref:Uncharacterized protein n=2 Tax=Popillia japonica TaxID=7064 RepID=A0AAW1IAZ2_POPJA